MKKIVGIFLSICLMFTLIIPVASADEVKGEVPVLVNERVTSVLIANNIDFHVDNGTIKLTNTSPQFIAEVNGLLGSKYQFNWSTFAAVYPGPWHHLVQYDNASSKKFTAATKTAFSLAFAAWVKNIFGPWQEIVAAAVAGYGTYYFVNSETEDLYTFVKYYFRELGPGFFDHNGNFYGDYEIRREIRVTKNSNGTGGSVENYSQNSTGLVPWF
ncbi:hypothetical protein [Cohnella hongkongensis]|uniref:Uncharacterized protein n=1 Tax=Cohnella hongkongensis TaxID=178337 RepID=A0ABV9FJ77_9BACL